MGNQHAKEGVTLPLTITTPAQDGRGCYQDMVLTLEDGRKITACVEAFCGFDEDKPMLMPMVVEIALSRPAPVPEGLFVGYKPQKKGGKSPC